MNFGSQKVFFAMHLVVLPTMDEYVSMVSKFHLRKLKLCFHQRACVLRKLEMGLTSIWLHIQMNLTAPSSLTNRAKFGWPPYLSQVQELLWGWTFPGPLWICLIVFYDSSFGMMGMAFHPNFAHNGRFFASFNCYKLKTTGCSGRCACNTDVDCDPSKICSSNAAEPCRYHKLLQSSLLMAHRDTVRRNFTLGLPFAFNHAGQILVGPADGYLHVMMGDGGKGGDPYYFSQNKKSLLGKILRLDIDNLPSADEIVDLDLWGNYSIAHDNPSSEDNDLQPEIWALGLRNPWRCSFDSERSLYFVCADTGQDHYGEVDNHQGWELRVECLWGPFPYNPHQSTANSINPIFPVLGYNHSDVNDNEGSAAISGGYFYRSLPDPCMFGSYLYADLYGSAIWAAAESPANSGNFTSTMIPFSCSHDSPIHCSSIPGNSLPALGYTFSFGEDNRKDIFILASSGVYRVVHPSRCNYTCSKENVTAVFLETPSSGNQLTTFHWMLLLSLSFLGFLLSTEIT